MATHDRGGASSQAAAELSSDSESGSSYVGSGQSSPGTRSSGCRWRTSRFHDQECSRYFDCPSHIVERAMSHDEGADGTVSPVSDGSGSGAGQVPRAREAVSPPHEPFTASGPEESQNGDDEVIFTGSRNISDGPAARLSTRTQASRGTAENPIVLSDDSPPQGSNRHQPFNVTATTAIPSSSTLPAPTYNSPIPPAAALAQSVVASQALQATRPPLARPVPTSPDIVLPRWQPDAEVTYCPICSTQFSIFVRKHHCRKCGRVVCNRCSPHRITIPYQYIVRLPGVPSYTQSRNPSHEGGPEQILGGGERVRLCNPCVPDPNVAPPQQAQSAHSRSQSSVAEGAGPYSTHLSNQTSNSGLSGSFFGAAPASNAHARSRSVTVQHHGGPSGSRVVQYNPVSSENQILFGTPPVSYPRTLLPQSTTGGRSSSEAGPSVFAARPLPFIRPMAPQPVLAEEDECPVCHRELPSQDLHNSERLREAHVQACITAHSAYSGGVAPEAQAIPGGAVPSPSLVRRTGMFPYAATEKDCVDSAECTICLEEFEVGVSMARLECLCRFHRECITAWWENHPGRCPVHQHDGFGY